MRTDASSRGEGGFSLVELLVVMAIGIILAAVALPTLARTVRNYKISGAAKQVAGDLQTARSKAIMTNTNNGVSLVIVDANTYRYIQEDLNLTTNEQYSPLQDLPSGVRFVSLNEKPSASTSIRFLKLGGFCNPMITGACARPPVAATCLAKELDRCSFDTAASGKNYLAADSTATGGVDGGMYVQLLEESTGLMRRVHIAPGGRIRAAQGQAD